MLDQKSDEATVSMTVSVQDELVCIRQRLMAKDYGQLDDVPLVLKLIQDMLSESHPSGYPAPDTLSLVNHVLRGEKFKEQREKQCATPLSMDIQALIDRLNKLKVQAEAGRAKELKPSNWASRSWEGGMLSQLLAVLIVLPGLILVLFFPFINISESIKYLILVTYFLIGIVFAIVIKDGTVLSVVVYCFIFILFPSLYFYIKTTMR